MYFFRRLPCPPPDPPVARRQKNLQSQTQPQPATHPGIIHSTLLKEIGVRDNRVPLKGPYRDNLCNFPHFSRIFDGFWTIFGFFWSLVAGNGKVTHRKWSSDPKLSSWLNFDPNERMTTPFTSKMTSFVGGFFMHILDHVLHFLKSRFVRRLRS